MKTIALITTLSLSVLFAASGCAAVQEDHKAHHASASSAEQAGPQQAMPMMQDDANDPMENQMNSMREIHKKMMQATSSDERKKLMAEHTKAMQGGMAMMQSMQEVPMKHEMPMKKDMPMMTEHSGKPKMKDMQPKGDGMKCDMSEGMASHMMAKHKMMENRMKMMETMMQMMMDRMINDDYDEHQAGAKK